MAQYSRIRRPPRGLVVATGISTAVLWALYLVSPHSWPGLPGAIVQTAAYAGNLALTTRSRRVKQLIVRTAQRWLLNPLFTTLFAIGLNPLGLMLLETVGRTSGRPRRTPVGNGRHGDQVWVIAEHGLGAGYVRNIMADPAVRVRVRVGLRRRWLAGVAEVLPDDDALARQRRIIRWHPLRMLNALAVRNLGTDLVTVRIALGTAASTPRPAAPRRRPIVLERSIVGYLQPAAPDPRGLSTNRRPPACDLGATEREQRDRAGHVGAG